MTTVQAAQNQHTSDTAKFIKKIMNPLNQWLFLWLKLPAAKYMGVKLRELTPKKSVVTVPYNWRSQNPFRSTYFAAQAAAAEFSTGVLASMAIYNRGKISMLITGMTAEYIKKVDKLATFTCTSGADFFEAAQRAIDSGEGQSITVESIGTMPDKDGKPMVVSKFYFTWSLKAKGG